MTRLSLPYTQRYHLSALKGLVLRQRLDTAKESYFDRKNRKTIWKELWYHTYQDLFPELSLGKRHLEHQDPKTKISYLMETREAIQKELGGHTDRHTVSTTRQLASRTSEVRHFGLAPSQSKALLAAGPRDFNSFKTKVFAIDLSSAPGPRSQPVKSSAGHIS